MPRSGVLTARIRAEAGRPLEAAARAVSDAIVARHGTAVLATIFYGSCLRPPARAADAVDAGAPDERILDFYAIVDRLRDANAGPLSALGNHVLPPNVFYIEVPLPQGRARCKYAVISLGQLQRLTGSTTLQNYFWGRFCQPVAVPFARDQAIGDRVVDAMAAACRSFVEASLSLMRGPFSSQQLWIEGFAESYRAELRAENAAARARLLYEADAVRYDAIAAAVLAERSDIESLGEGNYRFRADALQVHRSRWPLRRLLGKSLNALRIVKAAYTFTGGLDYLLWKIERHSGVRLAVGDWPRRHPVLCAPWLAWRAWRAGAFR